MYYKKKWVMVFILYMLSNILFAQNNTFSAVIKPSMGLIIRTYPDTTNPLNGFFIVDDRGVIELPYLGEVKVAGSTKNQLKSILKERAKKYVKFDYIQVDILIRLGFLGGFENPGFYYVNPHQSLWEALRITGGFLEEKGFKKMSLYRGGGKIKFEAGKIISGGRSLIELGIKNGDIFTAPIPNPRSTLWQKIAQTFSIVTTAAAIYFTYVTLVINARRAR